MNKSPLVSVICLCHNHEKYVAEAIESVLNQSHKNIELIVVDDGSTDGSKQVVKNCIKDQDILFIDHEIPIGNCKSFNKGFQSSEGEYIIDLAADDLLLSERIEKGIETFSEKSIGVEYCDVEMINTKGDRTFIQSKRFPPKEGDIYLELIQRYFISAPGMMIKRSVLEDLEGYDESLGYEDFDFWIRSSRNYHYGFTDQTLVKKRVLASSLSRKQFRFRSKHQRSTLEVCKKIKQLNRSREEDQALKERCWYEVKQSIRQGNLELVSDFIKLMRIIG